MKNFLKAASLSTLLIFTSCAHYQGCKKSCCSSQCEMKKGEQCPMKGDHDMKDMKEHDMKDMPATKK
jgi:hypothetical protein